MRPVEFTPEAIIQAGQALQASGRNVTGFGLRQKVGGGNPTRLRQVWDDHLASTTIAQAQPMAELPVEVAEEVANVTKMLTERIALLAAELNNKAVKAAERRVAEVLRTAGEQREQAERELADAATTVDALEAMLDETKAEALTAKFVESQTHGQVQAVELAQLRERLTASEKHAAELEALRNLSTAELDRMRVELASVKATAESELRHASEEARNHKLATEQAHELLSHTREELSQARNQTAEAREEAARLRGQVEATEGRCTELMKVLAERPVAVDTGEKPATAANDTK